MTTLQQQREIRNLKLHPRKWRSLVDIPPELHLYYILGYNSAVDGYEKLDMPMSQRKIAYNMGWRDGMEEIKNESN